MDLWEISINDVYYVRWIKVLHILPNKDLNCAFMVISVEPKLDPSSRCSLCARTRFLKVLILICSSIEAEKQRE